MAQGLRPVCGANSRLEAIVTPLFRISRLISGHSYY